VGGRECCSVIGRFFFLFKFVFISIISSVAPTFLTENKNFQNLKN